MLNLNADSPGPFILFILFIYSYFTIVINT